MLKYQSLTSYFLDNMTQKNWQPPTPDEIKDLREQTGFTQAKTAHLCRIGLRAYQRWETGEIKPSQASWDLYQLELKARQNGYQSLEHLVDEVQNTK